MFPARAAAISTPPRSRRRFDAAQKRAGLRTLRLHDLRHSFGSLAINRASIVQVQGWMGHADVKTTMRYLHHKSQAGDAQLLAGAFAAHNPAAGVVQASELSAVPNGADERTPAPGGNGLNMRRRGTAAHRSAA